MPPNDAGVFYPYPPDVAIVQFMFLPGSPWWRSAFSGWPGRPRPGRGCAGAPWSITAAGAAATLTAAGLAATARQVIPGTSQPPSATTPLGMQGAWIIPALHDAASDRPIPYTPVCATVTIPVCIHPAFKDVLPDVTAALGPVLRELAGLPGAPVRAQAGGQRQPGHAPLAPSSA